MFAWIFFRSIMAQADQIFAPTTKKSQSVFLLLLLSCAMWRISKNILVSYERFFLFSLSFFVGFLSFEYCLHCFISAWAIITTSTNFYVWLSKFRLIFQISCQLVASAKTKSQFKMLFTRFFAHTFCIRRFFLSKKLVLVILSGAISRYAKIIWRNENKEKVKYDFTIEMSKLTR